MVSDGALFEGDARSGNQGPLPFCIVAQERWDKSMFITENQMIGLMPYTHNDDYDMYMCWQDIDTQKGYNGIFTQSFDEFQKTDIHKFKFWVTVVDKNTEERVGVLRLGLDEMCPDLAIWIYPSQRNKGYGTEAFRLALNYIFDKFQYKEISAGCYCDNEYSLKMLRKIGFARYPEGDGHEINCFTGKETTQLEFRLAAIAREHGIGNLKSEGRYVSGNE